MKSVICSKPGYTSIQV